MDRKCVSLLDDIRGKTIAVVYIFEGEGARGYEHYDIWKGDVISDWLNAIQEIGCLPFILDTRTFIQKAMNGSLPVLDYVVNLNAGNYELSSLSLVPSVCSFLSIPCIPCNSFSIVTGENKLISNLIAYSQKMNVPQEIEISHSDGILRPLNYGSSRGIRRGDITVLPASHIYQEFIVGFDMTIPLIYNPLIDELEVLPAVMYYPITGNMEWFLGEEEKEKHQGYSKRIVHIDCKTKQRVLKLAKIFSINTFCRIDTRVKCSSLLEMESIITSPIKFEKVYFLEINPMPTIKENINFHTSLTGVTKSFAIYEWLEFYKKRNNNFSYTGFILACSMLGHLKAKH